MTKRHLVLCLDAPLMAFGGVMIDNFGKTDAFPSASLLTGLLGNALGFDRTEGARLAALQDRLIYAVRVDAHGASLMDFQTAALRKNDKGWTTRGTPEGRDGGAGTYESPHLRFRDYWADRIVVVALRLEPAAHDPTLDGVAAALNAPARPLFIGRKPCLPSRPLFNGVVEAENALAALCIATVPGEVGDPKREAYWPPGEDSRHPAVDTFQAVGERNWVSGVHGGIQRWRRGMITLEVGQ